jgi:hypothetical protein
MTGYIRRHFTHCRHESLARLLPFLPLLPFDIERFSAGTPVLLPASSSYYTDSPSLVDRRTRAECRLRPFQLRSTSFRPLSAAPQPASVVIATRGSSVRRRANDERVCEPAECKESLQCTVTLFLVDLRRFSRSYSLLLSRSTHPRSRESSRELEDRPARRKERTKKDPLLRPLSRLLAPLPVPLDSRSSSPSSST